MQHQIIKNFKNVLAEAGSSLEKIVKINIFIANMNDFGAMNEVYTQYFKKPNLPCRTYVLIILVPEDHTNLLVAVWRSRPYHLTLILR